MQRPIKYYGDPVLRMKGAEITRFNAELKVLISDMIETMYSAEGIGLAAQQIGIAQQLCVIDVRPPKDAEIYFNYSYDGKSLPLDLFMPLALVNPKITVTDHHEDIYEEGCLSFPDLSGNVMRPTEVCCAFKDAEGNNHSLNADGLLARCILHEVDHLNGVLFIDKMDKKDLNKISKEIKDLKKSFKSKQKG